MHRTITSKDFTGRIIGARQHGGLLGVERAQPEVGVPFVLIDGGAGEGLAVG